MGSILLRKIMNYTTKENLQDATDSWALSVLRRENPYQF